MNQPDERSWLRWGWVAVLVVGSALFSFLNAGERVTLELGVFTLFRISLVGLVFVAFLLGMLTMFLFGLRQDRRLRAALRDREHRQPRVREPYPYEPPPDTIV